jgi:heat shock protein HslJ/uncharacterized lipoprotein NlpE involved in copper resistance
MILKSHRTRRTWAALLPALLILLSACTPITPDGAGGVPTQAAPAVTTAPTEEAATEPAATSVPTEEAAGAGAAVERAVVGIYKGFFPGASSPGLDTTLYLNADGTLQLVSNYLNEEAPMVETGEWTVQDDAVAITLPGPATFTLTVTGDQLAATDWIGPWYRFDALATGVVPAYDATAAAAVIAADGVMGYYKHFARSASCCGQDVTLLLAFDNTAYLTTDYLNGEPSIVETGSWEAAGGGLVSVTLAGRTDGTLYEAPVRFVLDEENGLLVAVEVDESRFGQEGLSFYFFPALAMASVGGTLSANVAVSPVGTYTGTLPAASGPGRMVSLTLDATNQAVMTTGAGSGEPALIELGVWESGADDTVMVMLSGRADGTDYEVPVRITFELVGEVLTAVEYDMELFGQQGMQLTRVAAMSPVSLEGVVWQLREIQMMDDTVFRPADPAAYTLQFSADGSVAVQADCNQGSGPYTRRDSQLTFGPLAVTEAMCAADSLSDRMLQGLNDAHSFVMDAGNLAIAFGPDSGILVFAPAAE